MEFFVTIVLSILMGGFVTWLISNHFYRKSSKDLIRFIRRIAPEKDTKPETSAAELLLELVEAFEKNEIYWPQFIIAARTMKRAGQMAGETIERIFSSASQQAIPTTPKYFEAQNEARRIEIPKLKMMLKNQLKK